MSNDINTRNAENLYEKACEIVEANPTIPEELKEKLIMEKYVELWNNQAEADIDEFGEEFYE